MTFIDNFIYFLIIFLNNFSEIIFCSDIESNQVQDLLEITRASLIGGYRLNELLRTVSSYDGKLSYTKYLVSLRQDEDETNFGYNHLCGGVILNEKLVLTAAHCLIQYACIIKCLRRVCFCSYFCFCITEMKKNFPSQA